MSKNYKHATTGQPCNAGQYIAEMMCVREAESATEGMPAHKLWNTNKWKNKYRSQVTKAYQLLQKYNEIAIINALKTPEGKKIYSLRNARLKTILNREQKKLDKYYQTVMSNIRSMDIIPHLCQPKNLSQIKYWRFEIMHLIPTITTHNLLKRYGTDLEI